MLYRIKIIIDLSRSRNEYITISIFYDRETPFELQINFLLLYGNKMGLYEIFQMPIQAGKLKATIQRRIFSEDLSVENSESYLYFYLLFRLFAAISSAEPPLAVAALFTALCLFESIERTNISREISKETFCQSLKNLPTITIILDLLTNILRNI